MERYEKEREKEKRKNLNGKENSIKKFKYKLLHNSTYWSYVLFFNGGFGVMFYSLMGILWYVQLFIMSY